MSVDPVIRHVVGGRVARKQAASTSQVARFETDVLIHLHNLAALMSMPGEWVYLIRQRHSLKELILDMDPGAPGLRDKLIKIGAKMVRHARYITFQLAEVTVPRRLYRTILDRIRRFGAISPKAAPI